MHPVECRNCGSMHFFYQPPPQRVKCQSCGNTFRTDKPRNAQLHEAKANQIVERARRGGAFQNQENEIPPPLGDFRYGEGATGIGLLAAVAVVLVTAIGAGAWYVWGR